jgi:ADP-dependent NAD(P)H-hydrate dehydratase / NAD(P)H-hydrate epimerase
MESAGRAAADLAQALAPRGAVGVLAGAGNNGGDAVVLARTLWARGRTVTLFADPRRPSPDPLLSGHRLPVRPLSVESLDGAPAMALWVDGLLGTGLRGAPRPPVADWIEALNRRSQADGGVPVLALDVPSGIDADTGAVPGAAVQAHVTAAFGAPKLGSLFHPARARGGRIVVLEIGFPPWEPGDARCALITEAGARAVFPHRGLVTHKNAVGRLLLLAGGPGMGGAAVLAARGALRAGVGMLRVLTDPVNRPLLNETVPEAVVLEPPKDPETLEGILRSVDAVVAGPGMGLDLTQTLGPAALLRNAIALVGALGEDGPVWLLDADALTLLAQGALPGWEGFRECLLTPHAGEMARLLAEETRGAPDGSALRKDGPVLREDGPVLREDGPAQRALFLAGQAADRWKGTVLFKGTPSVVLRPGGAGPRVSASGSSAFARAGMGDVLAGVAGVFLARGAGPADAASLALHLTGRASELAMSGEGDPDLPYRGGTTDTLLPSDVIDALAWARAELEPDAPLARGTGGERLASVTLELEPPR